MYHVTSLDPISGRCLTTSCSSQKEVVRPILDPDQASSAHSRWPDLSVRETSSRSDHFSNTKTLTSLSSPADFLLDAISVDRRTDASEEVSGQRVSRILDVYKRTTLVERRQSREVLDAPDVSMRLTAAHFTVAFPVILGRSFKCATLPK